ncbi:MAG: hypothetical protein QNJ38_09000 [Prochloraceae cyanobacterium]|nr:hypothetical protein [Prochloraceae cyanobacterium]
MVVTDTKEFNSVSVSKLVRLEIEPELKLAALAAISYYILALGMREVLEVLQLWLGMKFGFNIVGILLG